MKKINLTNKLSFKKETIAKLNDDQMSAINGGWATGVTLCAPSCLSCFITCTLQTGAPCNPKVG